MIDIWGFQWWIAWLLWVDLIYIVKNVAENITKYMKNKNTSIFTNLQVYLLIVSPYEWTRGIPWFSHHYTAATDLYTQSQLFVIQSVWSRYLQWFISPARYDQQNVKLRACPSVCPSVRHTLRVPICVQHPAKAMTFQQFIMHALQCSYDVDMHLLFCFDICLHLTCSQGPV